MVKATKKSFSKKSRSMRRKTMGGKRKNKSSKAQRRMKKMVGGARVTGSGIVIDEDKNTLTVEWGDYADKIPPIFYGQRDDGSVGAEGTVLNFHFPTRDGGNEEAVQQFTFKEPMEGQKWSTTIDGTLYNLTCLSKVYPKPSEDKLNVKFVFKIDSPTPSP
jgi:hypothetical protein